MDIKEMVSLAQEAQKGCQARFDQDVIDQIVKAFCRVAYDNAKILTREAIDETEMSIYKDEAAKCRSKSKGVWDNLQGKKSIGVLDTDKKAGLIRIAKPVGIVAVITPVTNPIVTPMANVAFTLKIRNATVVPLHPYSKNCSTHTIRLILGRLKGFSVPENLTQYATEPSIQAT